MRQKSISWKNIPILFVVISLILSQVACTTEDAGTTTDKENDSNTDAGADADADTDTDTDADAGSGDDAGKNTAVCEDLPTWDAFSPSVGGLFPNIVGLDSEGEDLDLCKLVADKPYIIDISTNNCPSCESFAGFLSGLSYVVGNWNFAVRASNFNTKLEAGTLGLITLIAKSYTDLATPIAVDWHNKYPHDYARVIDAKYAPQVYERWDVIIPNGVASFYYIDTDMTIIGYSHGSLMDEQWGVLDMANEI